MKLRLSKAVVLKLALAAAGCLLVASIVVGTEQDKNGIAEARSPAGSAGDRSAKSDDQLNIAALHRPTATEMEDNLFASRTPSIPAASALLPAPSPGPPAKPTAPRVPFKFLGKLVDRGVTTIFLAQSGRNLSVKQGDVVDDMYRIEEVRDTEIVFTYLPLQVEQVLLTGRRN